MRRATRIVGTGLWLSVAGMMTSGCAAGTSDGAPAASAPNDATRVSRQAPSARGSDDPGAIAAHASPPAPVESPVAAAQSAAAAQPELAAALAEFPPESPRDVEVAQAGTRLPAGAKPVAPAVPAKPFEFAQDAAGRLAAERLPPPKSVAIPNVPWVAEPRPAPFRSPDAISGRLAPLPEAPSTADSRPLAVEQLPVARTLPTYDRPPLPELTAALAPAQVEHPQAPRAKIASRSVSAALELSGTRLPFDPRPVPQDDPSATMAQRQLLAALPVSEPVPPPPERLAIPDPFEHLRTVAVKTPPAESIAPSASRDRPAAIGFDVAP